MTDPEDLNAELAAFGLKLATFALHNSNFQIERLDGRRGYLAEFESADGVREYLDRLANEEGTWCLDLDHGNVDVDRTSGDVSPRGEGRAFNLRDLHIRSITGRSPAAPAGLGSGDVRCASEIGLRTSERPDLCGIWFKRLN